MYYMHSLLFGKRMYEVNISSWGSKAPQQSCFFADNFQYSLLQWFSTGVPRNPWVP